MELQQHQQMELLVLHAQFQKLFQVVTPFKLLLQLVYACGQPLPTFHAQMSWLLAEAEAGRETGLTLQALLVLAVAVVCTPQLPCLFQEPLL
jgi:hypothetical protein